MDSRQWVSAAALTVGVFVVVVFSDVKTATGAPQPSQVTVNNTAANPVPITGQVTVGNTGNGFSVIATAVDTGAELSTFVTGPLPAGRFDPIVLENVSVRIQAPAGRVITALVQIYPPSGEFDDRVVSHIPLTPQGTFGIFAVYSANVPLRLYSSNESGNSVNFLVQCGGCGASDTLSAQFAVSGQTNP